MTTMCMVSQLLLNPQSGTQHLTLIALVCALPQCYQSCGLLLLLLLQVGLFSLGIIPYINASIVLQLMSAAFPQLKKMQREDGPQGRARFQYYQKLAAFVFAIAQVCTGAIIIKF
jgi:preprotein translocase subunit SecY